MTGIRQEPIFRRRVRGAHKGLKRMLVEGMAETITLNFTAAGLTGATSSNIVVGPATADRLVFALQPGGVSRTGSPLATQPVVETEDPFGNFSTVGLPANLDVTMALTAGSGTLLGTTTLDVGTAGGDGTVAYTDLQITSGGTNKVLTASAAGLTSAVSSAFNLGGLEPATGGSAISADTTGGTYTTLTGPTYYEAASGDVGVGTIILNAPAGFRFDTGGTTPTVLITRLTGGGSSNNNINDLTSGTTVAVTGISSTQMTFTITAASANAVTCSLTWQNVRVRPTAGTPLATGNLVKTGTSVMAVATDSAMGGTMKVSPGRRTPDNDCNANPADVIVSSKGPGATLAKLNCPLSARGLEVEDVP